MITCSFEDCRSTHGASGKRQFNCESSSAASLRNILNFCFLTCSLYIYLYEFHSAVLSHRLLQFSFDGRIAALCSSV